MERKYVMLVEDDPNDIHFIDHAFGKLDIPVSLTTASDGKTAFSILKNFLDPSDDDMSLPDLIILDLKLPGISGFEILEWIREQDVLKHIPVLILSSSSHNKDILNSYRLGANSYLVKPNELKQLIDIVKTIKDYWFDINRPAEYSDE